MASTLPSGITKKVTTYRADPKAIGRREGWNPRKDFGEIAELAKSIAANGMLNPLRVKRVEDKPHAFELIDGDRRLTAVELLMEQGHVFEDGVPITLVDKSQDDVTSLVQMFEANTSKGFAAMEEAEAFKRMRDAGLTLAEICARVGRGDCHVIDHLALLDAPAVVKDSVKAGKVGKTIAVSIAKVTKGDDKQAAELIEKAAKATATKDAAAMRDVKASVRRVQVQKAALKGKTLSATSTTIPVEQINELLRTAVVQGDDPYHQGVANALRAVLGLLTPAEVFTATTA